MMRKVTLGITAILSRVLFWVVAFVALAMLRDGNLVGFFLFPVAAILLFASDNLAGRVKWHQ